MSFTHTTSNIGRRSFTPPMNGELYGCLLLSDCGRDSLAAGTGNIPFNIEHDYSAPDDVADTEQLEVFIDILKPDSFDAVLNLALLCECQHFL